MYQSSNSDDNLVKNNYMNSDINRLREFQNFLKEDDSQIKEIIRNNSSINNEDFSVNLNDLKAILFEIASFYQVNLETFLESFLVKFRDNDLISYLDFMNYFIENLEKQEKILAAININNNSLDFNYNNVSYFNPDLTENYNQNISLDNSNNYKVINNSLLNPAVSMKKDDFDYQSNKISSINLNNLNETDNLFLMILHRSLYILKKKFELHKNEINSIYDEHSEKGKFNKILNTDNFVSVLDKIFKTCKINFLDINQPSDLFKAEIIENYSDEKLIMVEKQIKFFMLNGRKYFNDRFKYKREKEFYEIFLKEKEAVTNSLKRATENNINIDSNSNTIINSAVENATHKNPSNSKPLAKKNTINKLNESTNNANNVSLNESKISKVNDPKKRESNANSSLKNLKSNNTANANSKNLNVSQRKETEAVKSISKNDSVTAKNNAKEPVSKQASSKSLVSNKKQEEDNEEAINDIDLNANNENLDVPSNANLLEENLDLNANPSNENLFSEKNNTLNDLNVKDNNDQASAVAGKSNKNDLIFAVESLEDFKVKKLDDEIKTIILEDMSISELNLKINKNANQDNSVRYLIADAIPLIIADFIHENINIAILDMSEDLKSDLRGLFDKEIIKKIEEASQYDTENERVLKLKEYLFEKLNTQKNIKIYEDLFLTKKTQGENTSHILNILEKLRNHSSLIDRKIKKLQNLEQNNDNLAIGKGQTVIENVLDLNNNYNTNALNDYALGYNKANKVFVTKVIPKKSKTKEEIRMENFKQIFDFYAKQHQFASKNATFEEIQEKFNVMVLAEYTKFAIEFKIPLKKELVIETFKKHAKNAKDMHFEEFMQSLDKISTRINEEKIKSNLSKIKKLRAILAGKDPAEAEKNQKQKYNLAKKQEQDLVLNIQEDENNQENNQNNPESTYAQNENENNEDSAHNNNINNNFVLENNSSVNLNLKENNQNNNENNVNPEDEDLGNTQNQNLTQNPTELEIKKTQKQIFVMKKKTAAELLNELYDLMQIDDPKAYQPKMKGFVLPFSSDKLNIRLPEGSPGKRIFKVDPISQENLKRILKERKEQKLKESEEKGQLEKLNILENKKKAKLINEKIKNNIANNHEKLYTTKDKIPNKYSEIRKKQENIIKEKDTKLTWDQLENLNFNHFITNREDDFNPNDLFDDIYDSDDENIFDDNELYTDKNTLNNKTKKSKDTASSYLNIQTNLNIINNNNDLNSESIINLNSSAKDTIPDSIIKSYSGKTSGSSNVQYSTRAYNNNINIAQYAVNNLNARNQSGNKSSITNHRQDISLHSSNEGNHSNLSIFDDEYHKHINKNPNIYATSENYEMHRRSPRNRSPKGVGKASVSGNSGYNQKLNRNSEVYGNGNVRNLIVRNNSPTKVLNRSIEKSARGLVNKNQRNSSKSNMHVNPNQRYAGVQSPKSIKGLNNEKINKQIYSLEKTEKMAKVLEMNREDQKSRLMKKHDDLVKKSIDKIKKYL